MPRLYVRSLNQGFRVLVCVNRKRRSRNTNLEEPLKLLRLKVASDRAPFSQQLAIS
jgi:hypothetical protein